MTKRVSGVSDWPYDTTCPGLMLRSTMVPLRGARTTTSVLASACDPIAFNCVSGTPSVPSREAARSRSATALRYSFSAARTSFWARAFASKRSRARSIACSACSASETAFA